MNCAVLPLLPPDLFLLICIMQLETHGLFVDVYSGDQDTVWRMGRFRKVQKEVRRIFFPSAIPFREQCCFNLLFVRMSVLSVLLLLGIFSLGCCM